MRRGFANLETRYSQIDFWRRCRFPRWNDWSLTYTKQGINRQRRAQMVRILALAAIVLGVHRARENGVELTDAKQLILRVLQGSFARILYACGVLRGQAQAVLKK